MPGYSLHIGLNQIDPAHYGNTGQLRGCENDARDMKDLAESVGFNSTTLLTAQATTQNVVNTIKTTAQRLNANDIFFISYSGHGGQVPDTNNDETDLKDETWCLYDRQFVDDWLYSLWTLFKPGVRIIVLSDSCHSGTVIKTFAFENLLTKSIENKEIPEDFYGVRVLPQGMLEETYRRHKDLYDLDQLKNPRGDRAFVSASVILISGCQDNQLSADGPNGLFTETLKEVWSNGGFTGSFMGLHQQIWQRMPNYQKPNYLRIGAPNPDFDNQQAFKI